MIRHRTGNAGPVMVDRTGKAGSMMVDRTGKNWVYNGSHWTGKAGSIIVGNGRFCQQ